MKESIAIVTGASQGIGRATAVRLAGATRRDRAVAEPSGSRPPLPPVDQLAHINCLSHRGAFVPVIA
jgi:NAD(P)-dependent dehydrogenase (short-subunit alcohol dehydrogenase family)